MINSTRPGRKQAFDIGKIEQSRGAVAQPVERRSEGRGSVQLYKHGFEYQPRHKVLGRKILAGPSVAQT